MKQHRKEFEDSIIFSEISWNIKYQTKSVTMLHTASLVAELALCHPRDNQGEEQALSSPGNADTKSSKDGSYLNHWIFNV